MKCMSCGSELNATNTKIFNKILLCTQCHALAEKAEREIVQQIERAKEMSRNWLTQHILQGGLLRGGSGAQIELQGLPGTKDPG